MPLPPAAKPGERKPFVALLLPLQSPDFGAAAEAFRNGFDAAAQRSPGAVPAQVHSTDASAERIMKEYAAALEAGAAVVVGPMTRSGVTAVATSGMIMVPTLVLNQPEGNPTLPAGLYAFGLSVENEARAVAQQAVRDGLRQLAVVSTTAPLSRRSRDAFIDEWRRAGGGIPLLVEAPNNADLGALRAMLAEKPVDGVFLAVNAQDGRMMRPYVPSQMPVYATSHVHNVPTDVMGNVDLNNVRFVEMPWLLLSPEEQAVAPFARPANLSGDLLRFYALGVDTYAVAQQLAAGKRSIEHNGLTGHLVLRPDGKVERRPAAAAFREGAVVRLQ